MRQEKFSLPKPIFSHEEFLTVRAAIGNLPKVAAGEQCTNDPYHRSAAHRASTIEVIKAVPLNGGSRPPGVGPDCLDRIKGFYDVYGRLAWDKPAITITHYARNPASGRFIHPEQHRGLSMREAARLQGFPDQFLFKGGFDDVFRQIGEAVPPPMALAIAQAMAHNITNTSSESSVCRQIKSPVSDSYASVIAGIKARRK